MSLLKQLLISVTVAVCVILAGTLWFALDGARGYLNERLRADAGNAAASLALSLSQPANQDTVTQELLITALFDSGQYRNISLAMPDGKVRFSLDRSAEGDRSTVPRWFDGLLPLRAPTATRAFSDGWKQTGEVAVTPHDGYAREALWRMTYQVLLLVVGAGLLWALFAIFLVRWLRRALQMEISEQVRAIAEGAPAQQIEPQTVSRIKELAQVRNVIESVRERVRATADEQSRQIETLQLELNVDEVTGIANRKYFVNELRRTLQGARVAAGASATAYGHVLIFRQRDLAAINALHERSEADSWLRSVGDSVKRVIAAAHDSIRPEPEFARLNGSDFVVLLAGYDGPDTTDLIDAVRQTLDALRIRTVDDRLCRWSYALTDYGPSCDVGKVLARLDHGLMRAENAGHDEVEYISCSAHQAVGASGAGGESAWKLLIQTALADDRLTLNTQECNYKGDDTADRHEAFLILRNADEGNDISGYLFMPPAVRLGLSGACDLRAIELGLQWVRANPGTLSIRISLASLLQANFLLGVRELMVKGVASSDANRLVLEIDAHGFVAYPGEMDAFCEMARETGLGVGVRRLAEQPAALLRLHKVSIRYIKLGGDLISGLLESPGATQLIAAITEAAIGQGVKIYAHDVPNASTASLLLEYGVLLRSDENPRMLVSDEPEGEFVDD